MTKGPALRVLIYPSQIACICSTLLTNLDNTLYWSSVCFVAFSNQPFSWKINTWHEGAFSMTLQTLWRAQRTIMHLNMEKLWKNTVLLFSKHKNSPWWKHILSIYYSRIHQGPAGAKSSPHGSCSGGGMAAALVRLGSPVGLGVWWWRIFLGLGVHHNLKIWRLSRYGASRPQVPGRNCAFWFIWICVDKNWHAVQCPISQQSCGHPDSESRVSWLPSSLVACLKVLVLNASF